VANSEQQRRVEDRLWELPESLIPPRPVPSGTGGRSRIDSRAALEGVLFGLDTGFRWRGLPKRGLGVRAYRLDAAGRVAGRRCLGRSLVPCAVAPVDAVVLRVFEVLGVAQDGVWTVAEKVHGGTAKCSTIFGPFREGSQSQQRTQYAKQLNSR
jgi:hypothetical protein